MSVIANTTADSQPTLRTLPPSEALRQLFFTLAIQLRKWAEGKSFPVKIGITSLNDQAGKSTVAYNLAVALAKSPKQRVLLVEANFGSHYLVRRQESRPGFAEWLSGQVNLTGATFRTQWSGLDVLGCGHTTLQAAADLPFEMLNTLTDEQCGQYDFLIFDLPTASSQTTYPYISLQMDGVVLVIEDRHIEPNAIGELKHSLNQSGKDFVGMVVNKAPH